MLALAEKGEWKCGSICNLDAGNLRGHLISRRVYDNLLPSRSNDDLIQVPGNIGKMSTYNYVSPIADPFVQMAGVRTSRSRTNALVTSAFACEFGATDGKNYVSKRTVFEFTASRESYLGMSSCRPRVQRCWQFHSSVPSVTCMCMVFLLDGRRPDSLGGNWGAVQCNASDRRWGVPNWCCHGVTNGMKTREMTALRKLSVPMRVRRGEQLYSCWVLESGGPISRRHAHLVEMYIAKRYERQSSMEPRILIPKSYRGRRVKRGRKGGTDLNEREPTSTCELVSRNVRAVQWQGAMGVDLI